MMKKRKSTGIIKLEERVLFEAAAAPEIAALAAMNEAAADADNDAEADVQDSSGEKGDVPAGERAIDAIDKSALEAALAAGPDGANIAEEGVVRENGETADGLDAGDGNSGGNRYDLLSQCFSRRSRNYDYKAGGSGAGIL